MRLYDTGRQMYRAFEPTRLVKIYVCGITPYDSAHLGHIFTFMTYDLLQRRLEDAGHEVHMVRNITDVDDPLYIKAAELGTDYLSVANAEIASFQDILAKLNFRPAHAEPRATEYISQMADAVKELIDKGYAYYVERDIYFDTAKYASFGKFSGYNERLLRALMADRGGNPDLQTKRQPLDFLLWQHVADPADKAQWHTVLGQGRPGWHIECSVMSTILLGDVFDIHGGGSDLIFPHHESEIAQSIGLHGKSPARYWLHVSPMLMAGEKMSKSLGNMVFAADLLKNHEPAVVRLALMYYHHRMGGDWQPELLHEASRLLAGVRETSGHCDDTMAATLLSEVRDALDADIDTPRVIESLQRFVRKPHGSRKATQAAQATITQTLALLGLE